jgi:hypothetical protein
MYEYTGMLLGAHPILHISRIRVKLGHISFLFMIYRNLNIDVKILYCEADSLVLAINKMQHFEHTRQRLVTIHLTISASDKTKDIPA